MRDSRTSDEPQPSDAETWEERLDHSVEAGDVVPALAALLLSVARKRLAKRRHQMAAENEPPAA